MKCQVWGPAGGGAGGADDGASRGKGRESPTSSANISAAAARRPTQSRMAVQGVGSVPCVCSMSRSVGPFGPLSRALGDSEFHPEPVTDAFRKMPVSFIPTGFHTEVKRRTAFSIRCEFARSDGSAVLQLLPIRLRDLLIRSIVILHIQ